MSPSDSTREVAERQLREEEARRRAARLAELEAEEERRREDERRELEREERRAAARTEADEMAVRRGELVRSCEDAAAALAAAVGELEALDGEHRRKLQEAGESYPSEPVRALLRGWLAGVPGLPVEGADPWSYSGRNPRLLDRDPLSAKGVPRGE